MAAGHRERVLSLSQALATEASQWHKIMLGEGLGGRWGSLSVGLGGEGVRTGVRAPGCVVLHPERRPLRAPHAGGQLDSGGDPLAAAPSDPRPQTTPASTSPVADDPRPSSGRSGWEPSWGSGPSPAALSPEEDTWPLRVTLLQSSF